MTRPRIVTLDFETVFDKKSYTLTKMGPIAYIRDPCFAVLCIGVRVNKGPVQIIEHDFAESLAALSLTDSSTITVGHNIAGFDGLILSERFGIVPHRVIDTLCIAHWLGITRVTGSASHAALTEYLKTGTKLPGTDVSSGKFSHSEFTHEEWAYFTSYCRDDVLQCSENLYKMLPFVNNPDALTFIDLTAKMAMRPALEIDRAAAQKFIDDLTAERDKVLQGMDLSVVRSSKKFAEAFNAITHGNPPCPMKQGKNGMIPAIAKTDTVFTDLLEDPALDPKARVLIEARLGCNSSAGLSRAQRLLEIPPNTAGVTTLPFMLKTYHAHTGRYGAGNAEGATDGLNLQNMGKRDLSLKRLRKAIHAPAGHKIVAVDSSQIEARVLAFAADETELLGHFREGRDPYAELAGSVYGADPQAIHDGAKSGDPKFKRMRDVGKVAVLQLGYSSGWTKLSEVLWRSGTRLSENRAEHDAEAMHVHRTYRLKNPRIVYFWKKCQSILGVLMSPYDKPKLAFGGPHDNLFTYGLMQNIPSIRMPSGYTLRYPNLRANPDNPKEIIYDRGKSFSRIYGGSLTENLIQSLAFQILQWQACRMAKSGIVLHGNIHDAWFTVVPKDEVDKTVETMTHWMSAAPDWLPDIDGLLACEAEVGDDFSVV